MRRAIGLLGLLLATPVRGQMVESWPPAYSDVHAALDAASPKMHVMVGVPDEVMHVRLRAKAPASAAGWAVDLLQPELDTQTLLAGPAGTITLPPVIFGKTGAVVLRIRSLDGSSGEYVLRARGHLPPGFKHPDIGLAVPLGDSDGTWDTSSKLRPGLTLRARVRLPHDATSWPVGPEPRFFHIPPSLVAETFQTFEGVPGTVAGKAYPDAITFVEGAARFEHVAFFVEDIDVTLVGARVRRHKVVLGKPPLVPTAAPDVGPSVFESVDIDQGELAPGGMAHLTVHFATTLHPSCPDPKATASVWLSSVHRIDTLEFGGSLVAGPIEVHFAQGQPLLEADIQVPVDIAPGLWGVWVVLGGPDSPSGCDDLHAGEAAETVVRVLAP